MCVCVCVCMCVCVCVCVCLHSTAMCVPRHTTATHHSVGWDSTINTLVLDSCRPSDTDPLWTHLHGDKRPTVDVRHMTSTDNDVCKRPSSILWCCFDSDLPAVMITMWGAHTELSPPPAPLLIVYGDSLCERRYRCCQDSGCCQDSAVFSQSATCQHVW